MSCSSHGSHTHTEYWVCERAVTECLNYGLIVSLAGFCCCHHVGPVKVNYWNMFICCQTPLQAVSDTETHKHTQKRCSLRQFAGQLVSLSSSSAPPTSLPRHTLHSLLAACSFPPSPDLNRGVLTAATLIRIQVTEVPSLASHFKRVQV